MAKLNFSIYSNIGKWERSICSEDEENYSKNNDRRSSFFHEKLVKNSKKNDQKNNEITTKSNKRKEEDSEQEEEGTINISRIVLKKYEKGYNIDEEISKTRISGNNKKKED